LVEAAKVVGAGVIAAPAGVPGGGATGALAGGRPPAGVSMILSEPFTTLSVPNPLPFVPNPAYDEGKAVKFVLAEAGGGVQRRGTSHAPIIPIASASLKRLRSKFSKMCLTGRS
jgi:hypothetical protein